MTVVAGRAGRKAAAVAGRSRSERYCVVLATLSREPTISVTAP
jgi:hypothetical protein